MTTTQNSPSKRRNPFLLGLFILAVVSGLAAAALGGIAQHLASQQYGYGDALAVLKVSDSLWPLSALALVGWLVAASVAWRPKA